MAAMRPRASAALATVVASILVFCLGTSFVHSAVGQAKLPSPVGLRGSQRLRVEGARSNRDEEVESVGSRAIAGLAAFAAAVGMFASAASPARASGEIIGELEASGLIFKDTINVQRITDPKVSGVTLYQTDFSKSSFDKLKSGNLLQADPGASGLACTVSGKVLAKPDISKDKRGEEIYSEGKAFLGKTLKVKRVYDDASKNIVYVVYTERLNKDDDPNGSRFKSQACAVHVDGFE
eukprot:TRINITY_DN46347_c0_g1_i1.p1 TRINITY_DN46347_c0_g1~~TRINITY_DN46347_c0_g1_i1.p1  ORF type:complete len:237 (+),score=62.75 TRINITY_DN46347_c0_g1_i1:30-740(+)